MDIVLEFFEAFVFDPIWATLLPNKDFASANSYNSTSTATIGDSSTALPVHTWQFVPSSEYLSFEPSKYAYMSRWQRDDWRRQLITLFLITWLFGLVVYFTLATLSYVFVFDKNACNHPKYLKNQVRQEIQQATRSFPVMAVLTAPIFLLEVRGYTKMYDTTADGPGLWYNILQIPLFIGFTDYCIYWIHRYLHHPFFYKRLHKPHHKWIIPTPFASHAFHPLDGYAQGLPYHIFPYIFPLQKFASVFFFIFVNFWTIMIHDGEYMADNPIINGAACHTLHHLYFRVNLGQFTTLWDRLGGTYREPNPELFIKELKMGEKEWKSQAKEMEQIVKDVECEDDRTYVADEPKKIR